MSGINCCYCDGQLVMKLGELRYPIKTIQYSYWICKGCNFTVGEPGLYVTKKQAQEVVDTLRSK